MRRLLTYGIAVAFSNIGSEQLLESASIFAAEQAQNDFETSPRSVSIEDFVKDYFTSRPEVAVTKHHKDLIETELKAAAEKWQSHIELEPYFSQDNIDYSQETMSSKQLGFAAKAKFVLDHASGASMYAMGTEVLTEREENSSLTRKDYQIGLSQEINQNGLGKKHQLSQNVWNIASQREDLQQQKLFRTLCSQAMLLFNEVYYLNEVAASYRELVDHVKIVHEKMLRDYAKSLIPRSDILSIQSDYSSAQSSAFKAEQRLKEFIPKLGVSGSFADIKNPDIWYTQIYNKVIKNNSENLDIRIKELDILEKSNKVAIAELAKKSQVTIFTELHQTIGDLPGEEAWRSQNLVLGIRAELPLNDPGGVKSIQAALISKKIAEDDLLLSKKNTQETQSIIREKLAGFSGEEAMALKEMESSQALVVELQKLLKNYRVGLVDYRQARDSYIMKKIALLNVKKSKWDTITESIALNGTEENICF